MIIGVGITINVHREDKWSTFNGEAYGSVVYPKALKEMNSPPFAAVRPYATKINFCKGGPRGRVVKVADFSALDHSIISPMWVRASHGARIHM